MRISALCLILLLVATSVTRAGEATVVIPAPIENAQYSAGVFGQNDALVRTLAVTVPESEMPKSLNGLVLTWDGRDAYNGPMDPGEYPVEALAIPELPIQGVRYHFNDWIDDSSTLKVIRPTAGYHRPDGMTAAVLELDELKQAIAWFDADGVHVGTCMLPEDLPVGVAASDGEAVFLAGLGSVYRVPWGASELGEPVAQESPVMGLDWNGSEFAVLRSDGTAGVMDRGGSVSDAGLGTISDVRRFVRAGGRWLALESSGAVAQWTGDAWQEMKIPEIAQVDWLTAGVDGTFWVLGREEDDEPVAAQFGEEPDPLRTLALPEGFKGRFLSQLSKDTLLLIESRAAGTQFRALKLDRVESEKGQKEGAPVSVWKEVFKREVDDPANYLVKDGLPVPAATAGSPPPAAEIELQANPLSGDQKPKLTLSAALTPEGVWLSTSDGLLIVKVSTQDKAQWGFVTAGEKPGEVRLFEGLTWAIAEYAVTGVDGVIPIDGGEIQLPEDLKETAAAPEPTPKGQVEVIPAASPLPAEETTDDGSSPDPSPTPKATPAPSAFPPTDVE